MTCPSEELTGGQEGAPESVTPYTRARARVRVNRISCPHVPPSPESRGKKNFTGTANDGIIACWYEYRHFRRYRTGKAVLAAGLTATRPILLTGRAWRD